MLICNCMYVLNASAWRDDHTLMAAVANPQCSTLAASHIAKYLLCIVMHSRRTGCGVSPTIWRLIHSDVSEISIVSSWALTDVFRCEYQPRRWWISPFSFNLVTDSSRALWCQSCSPSSCSPSEHKSVSAAEYRAAAGVKWSLETPRPRRRWSSSEIRVTRPPISKPACQLEYNSLSVEKQIRSWDPVYMMLIYVMEVEKWRSLLIAQLNKSKIGLTF